MQYASLNGTSIYLFQEVKDTLDKDAVFRCMTQCYEMHTSERPKLEDIVRPEEGYMKSAKSLASLGGSLIQGVVVGVKLLFRDFGVRHCRGMHMLVL